MMSRLALGTVQFGLPYGISNQSGQVTKSVAKDMLHLARTSRIDTLDTAIAYGDSENCLGEIGSEGFRVVTKLPPIPEESTDVSSWVNVQIKASLDRLGLSEVYGLLLHQSSQLIGCHGEALFHAMHELRESGVVKKIGVSIYNPTELDVLIPKYNFDIVQAPLSLIDQRLINSGWLKRLKFDGVEIHTRSAFLQGLLLMPKNAVPSKFAIFERELDAWHRWLEKNSISALHACLAYPLSLSEVDRVVIGADSVAQLAQIIEVASHKLPVGFPDIKSDDDRLINPANWSQI
jgi:aryl-alcohol dehydrogenase-like predicted oxidoreductase